MKFTPHNSLPANSVPASAEETLRLIAGLPAPEGLEDRVHEALRAAPRTARVLAWPENPRWAMRRQSGWLRSAAAAVIVFVVVGGGWGVYTRVQHGQPAKVIVMPSPTPAAGGFSGAGAIRTPQTLQGPTVNQPARPAPDQPAVKTRPQAKAGKKPVAPAANLPATTLKAQPGPSN